jgi:hypothetical protein
MAYRRLEAGDAQCDPTIGPIADRPDHPAQNQSRLIRPLIQMTKWRLSARLACSRTLVTMRSLEDGLFSIDEMTKQIFFFDDFLGKTVFDRGALSYKDSDLARFIRRIRNSPNARFVLTTRACIFEEARANFSEHLRDQRLNITNYVLDVRVYTDRVN